MYSPISANLTRNSHIKFRSVATKHCNDQLNKVFPIFINGREIFPFNRSEYWRYHGLAGTD